MAAHWQAQRQQAQAKVAGALVVLRPGEGFPDAKVFLPDGHALRILAGTFAQHLRQGQFGKVHGVRHPYDNQRLRRL